MANQIKTVTDKSQFPVIINNFFSRGELFIKTSSADLAVQYLGFSDDQLALRIPNIKNLPASVICFTLQKGHTIYANLAYVERNEDTYIFSPVKFQILSVQRKEDRQVMDISGGSKNVMYVSNIISDFFITHALEMNDKRNEKIKEFARYELEKSGFSTMKIMFNYEAKNDIRMNHILTKKTPIFVPNLNSDPDPKYADDYNYYINNIYSRDSQFTGSVKYTAEALVPILHRNIIPYGYIQVNSLKPFSDGHLVVVKRIAIVIDQLFVKDQRFVPVPAKFLVSDISEGGFGIVFRDRSLARNFRKDSLMTSDMLLPTSKKIVFSAFVRSIVFAEGNLVKIGCQFSNMDDASHGNLAEYLDLVSRKSSSS